MEAAIASIKILSQSSLGETRKNNEEQYPVPGRHLSKYV
jgi:hypothetical protein